MDTFILIIDLKPLRWICIFVLCWKKRFGNRVQFYHHRLSQGTSLSPVLMDQMWQVHFTGGLERAESSSGFLPQFKAQSLGRRRLEARAASNPVCSWALLQVSLWNCGFSMELWFLYGTVVRCLRKSIRRTLNPILEKQSSLGICCEPQETFSLFNFFKIAFVFPSGQYVCSISIVLWWRSCMKVYFRKLWKHSDYPLKILLLPLRNKILLEREGIYVSYGWSTLLVW